jgi:hypothetical protein
MYANVNVKKTERKRPLGRPGCRWMDNIKMEVAAVLWESVDAIHLVPWWAVVNTVMNLHVS